MFLRIWVSFFFLLPLVKWVFYTIDALEWGYAKINLSAYYRTPNVLKQILVDIILMSLFISSFDLFRKPWPKIWKMVLLSRIPNSSLTWPTRTCTRFSTLSKESRWLKFESTKAEDRVLDQICYKSTCILRNLDDLLIMISKGSLRDLLLIKMKILLYLWFLKDFGKLIWEIEMGVLGVELGLGLGLGCYANVRIM